MKVRKKKSVDNLKGSVSPRGARDKWIRELYKKYSMAMVAAAAGVSKTTVFYVVHRTKRKDR